MSLEANYQLFLQVLMNKQIIEEIELNSILQTINNKYQSKKFLFFISQQIKSLFFTLFFQKT